MEWFLLVLALVMIGAAAHGIATGRVMTRAGEVPRAASPKTYWFWIVFYLVMGSYLGWLAYWDFFRRP